MTRRRRVTFLTFNVFGIGGIARVVINVANALAQTHDVEILSVLRSNQGSTFPIDERVRVTTLFDATRAGKRWRRKHPRDARSRAAGQKPLAPVLQREPKLNALVERRLRDRLRTTDADVIVSTRPTLHWVAAEMAPRDVGLIGWDHLNFETRFAHPRMAGLLEDVVPRLDMWVTLTEGDQADYRAHLGGRAPRIEVMRNSSGWVAPPGRASRDSRVVVAAGRLEHRKGFDRAIRAWLPLRESHPDWELHIHGSGPCHRELQQQIDELGLAGNVRMMGYTKDFQRVLGEAELFLMTSHAEGFPMVLVEAMSQGTPIVSFDCPRGPAEIVRSGANGLLLPNGDIDGLSAALADLLDDDVLRKHMGEQAMSDSREYEIGVISERWESLIDEAARSGAWRRRVRRLSDRVRPGWLGG